MIKGIGVDIAKISRFKDKDSHFVTRILSSLEKEIFDKLTEERKLEYLASRFSAKEAIYKAFNNNIDYSNISILTKENGAPYVLMETPFKVHISLSHEKEYVISYVIVEE